MPEPRGNNRAEAAGGSRGAAGRWRGGRRPAEGAERREPPPAPAERSGAGRAAAWRGAGRPPGTDRWSLPGGRPPARGQVSTAGPGRAEALPDPNLPPPPPRPRWLRDSPGTRAPGAGGEPAASSNKGSPAAIGSGAGGMGWRGGGIGRTEGRGGWRGGMSGRGDEGREGLDGGEE